MAKQFSESSVSLWEKLSYGGGDVANCITFCATSSYLSYYYTDIAGISLAAVGIILGTARILEAMANFLTGVAIDRTSSRLGKTRPYLCATTIPLMLCFFFVFTIPDISPTAKTAFAFVSYLLFCLLYAINNTAYGTLLSMMTANSKERLKINNFKLMGCGLGNLIASLFTLPLVALIGHGGHYRFVTTALLYAIVSLILLGNCAISCRERVGTGPDAKKISLGESLRCAVRCPSWLLLCIINCFAFMVMVLRNQGWIYYAKYCLGRESAAAILLSMSTIAMLVSAPFIARILTRLGNRRSMILGFVIYLAGSFAMYLSGRNLVLLVAFTFLCGLGSNLATGPAYSMCSDTIDEVEALTGKRPQGTMMSVMMCSMKLGIAGAGIFFSMILNAGGYVADAVQTPATLSAIRWNMFWLPMLLSAACLLLSFFFQRGRAARPDGGKCTK